MKTEYLLIDKSILPDYFELVLNVDDILLHEKLSVQAACEKAGISRSTYYKYKDKIIRPSKDFGKKLTISLSYKDSPLNLSKIFSLLDTIKQDVLSIYMDNPVNNMALIKITISNKSKDLEALDVINKIRELTFIEKADILRME